MARLGGSISLRLALGFLLVLAVFGIALLVSLHQMNQVKMANQRAAIRQELRRDANQIGRWASEMFMHQEAFILAEDVRWEESQASYDSHKQIDKALGSLLDQPIDDVERLPGANDEEVDAHDNQEHGGQHPGH